MRSKLVIITGGNSGIGNALVEAFYEGGCEVIIADKTDKPSARGVQYILDLTDENEVDLFIKKIIHAHGVPDIVIFNAGRGIHQKLSEGDLHAWKKIFAINVFSVLQLVRGLVPSMLERGRGDLIFISSVSADKPHPYGGVYCASKAALSAIAETLRLEVQPRLRVLNVLPGVVDTDFFGSIIGGGQTPENIGWGAVQPKEVADAVYYAVSQRNDISLNQIVIRPTAQPM